MKKDEKMLEKIIKELDSKKGQEELNQMEEKFGIVTGGGLKVSKQLKRRMNRYFREELNFKNIPHPEVDNFFERARWGFVRWMRRK